MRSRYPINKYKKTKLFNKRILVFVISKFVSRKECTYQMLTTV